MIRITISSSLVQKLLADAGTQPCDTERALRQMEEFIFVEFCISRDKVVKPLNANVHTACIAPAIPIRCEEEIATS